MTGKVCTFVVERQGGFGDCGRPAIARYTLRGHGDPFEIYRCARHEQGLLVHPPVRIVGREVLA